MFCGPYITVYQYSEMFYWPYIAVYQYSVMFCWPYVTLYKYTEMFCWPYITVYQYSEMFCWPYITVYQYSEMFCWPSITIYQYSEMFCWPYITVHQYSEMFCWPSITVYHYSEMFCWPYITVYQYSEMFCWPYIAVYQYSITLVSLYWYTDIKYPYLSAVLFRSNSLQNKQLHLRWVWLFYIEVEEKLISNYLAALWGLVISSFKKFTFEFEGTRWRSCWSTALRTRKSRDRFLMVSVEFFIDIILPAALWPWGQLSL
jgi:hypothetical protein